MFPSINHLNQSWTKVSILTVISCLLLLILSFDLFTTYQVIPFFLLLGSLLALVVTSSLAVSECISVKKLPSNRIIFSILPAILVTGCLYSYKQGVFYGKKLIDATFHDERSGMTLALYSTGHYIINSDWMFGSENFSGTYRTLGDSIIFNKFPVVDNDFVAQIIVKRGNRIYFNKDKYGDYKDTTYYYFKIH